MANETRAAMLPIRNVSREERIKCFPVIWLFTAPTIMRARPVSKQESTNALIFRLGIINERRKEISGIKPMRINETNVAEPVFSGCFVIFFSSGLFL